MAPTPYREEAARESEPAVCFLLEQRIAAVGDKT
jgi:hypothetical protein